MAQPNTNQGLRQESVRAVTSTTYTYDGDWFALFKQDGIIVDHFDGALLAWIDLKLNPPEPYGSLPEAMQAFAEDQGYLNWTQMGTFDAS